MEISGLGGGLMFAAAAGLWLVYLMPTWFRRREYLATERNAVRLQQTLRVLAETSEVPTLVRAETNAHSIAVHERTLREQRRKAEAVEASRDAHAARTDARLGAIAGRPNVPLDANQGAAALAAGAAGAEAIAAAAAIANLPERLLSPQKLAARRLRRSRATASLLTLVAIVVLLVQAIVMLAAGSSAASGAVTGFATVVAVIGLLALVRLSTVARRRTAVPSRTSTSVRTATASRTRMSAAPTVTVTEEPAASTSWTPVPVPKPLYLSRTEVPAAVIADPTHELLKAMAIADERLRAAQASPEVVPIVASPAATETTAPVVAGIPSRFARMGILDPADNTNTDLDAVLRRRRQAS